MFVRTWMTFDPLTVVPTVSLGEAAQMMSRHRVRRLLVTEPGSAKVAGLVSLHDVARAFPPEVNPLAIESSHPAFRDPRLAHPISEIMVVKPLTVSPDAPIEDAAELLRSHKVGALPVVEGERLVGIITESDVFRAFVDLSGVRDGVRIVFDAPADEDILPLVVGLGAARGARIASFVTFERGARRLAAVRFTGPALEELVEDVWRSRHLVLSVRTAAPAS
jgi:acetoin utilization protein AcuB